MGRPLFVVEFGRQVNLGPKTKASALNGIKSVKKHAKVDKNFERSKAKSGGACFVLKASNGEPIGRSQVYAGSSGCTGGIASVKRSAPGAKVEDLT